MTGVQTCALPIFPQAIRLNLARQKAQDRNQRQKRYNDFHNIGIGILRHRVGLAQQAQRELAQGHLSDIDATTIASEMSVLGRFLITKEQSDTASFKTPGHTKCLRDRAGRYKRYGMSWIITTRVMESLTPGSTKTFSHWRCLRPRSMTWLRFLPRKREIGRAHV